MKKKILLTILSFSILTSNFHNVNAFSFKDIFNRNDNSVQDTVELPDITDIDNYVVSGDGSESSPYVLNDNCPYNVLLDSIAYKYVDDDLNSSSSLGMTSKLASYQTTYTSSKLGGVTLGLYGGYYTSSKAPSANTDGTCWVRKMIYIPPAAVANVIKSNLPAISKIMSKLTTLVAAGYSGKQVYNAIYAMYTNKEVAAIAGISARSLGLAAVAYVVYSHCSGVIKDQKAFYQNCVNNGRGIVKIAYSISYHGNWYTCENVVECEWSTYPTGYKPNSCFGTGSKPVLDFTAVPNLLSYR